MSAMNHASPQSRSRSKRSGAVRLTRMVSTLGVLAAVSACGSEAPKGPLGKVEAGPKTEVLAFENAFECAAKTDMTQEECTRARNAALAANAESAPKFAGQGDCEAEWGEGSCVQEERSGRRYFAPFMVGWMMSGKGSGSAATPLYRHAGENGFSTAKGYRLGYAGKPGRFLAGARALETPKTVAKIKADSGRVSTGGFTTSRHGFAMRSGGSSASSRAMGG